MVAFLNRVVGVGHTERVSFEQRYEGARGVHTVAIPEGRASQAEGTASAKAKRLECAWQVSGTVKRSVCLEQSEGAGFAAGLDVGYASTSRVKEF